MTDPIGQRSETLGRIVESHRETRSPAPFTCPAGNSCVSASECHHVADCQAILDREERFPPAPAEKTFTQAEVNEMLDRDRIHGFLLFARSLRDDAEGPVWGTAHQVKAIQRALEKAGYK